MQDLNLRHHGYKPCALPIELIGIDQTVSCQGYYILFEGIVNLNCFLQSRG